VSFTFFNLFRFFVFQIVPLTVASLPLAHGSACNAVFQLPQGVHTLRNYGRKRNCSVSVLFPQSFRVLSASVGFKATETVPMLQRTNQTIVDLLATATGQMNSSSSQPYRVSLLYPFGGVLRVQVTDPTVSTSHQTKCAPNSSDYVQLLGGDGLDTDLMQVADHLCPSVVQTGNV
jgi:hypothetical protein